MHQRLRLLRKDEWVPDEEAVGCMKCEGQFSCWVRRHHCRFCGLVLCNDCSPLTLYDQRACRDCFQKSQKAEKRSIALNSPMLKNVKTLHPLVQREEDKPKRLADSPLIRYSRQSIDHMNSPSGLLPGSLSPKVTRGAPGKERKGSSRTQGPGATKSPTGAEPETEASGLEVERESKGVVVVVDPFSSGLLLAAECLGRGYEVLRCFSAEYPEHILNLTLDGIKVDYIGTVEHRGDLVKTVTDIKEIVNSGGEKKRKPRKLVAVMVGCETGVEVADAVAEALELRGNGTAQSEARRNKYLMGETIRQAGLRAVIQGKATTWVEVERFLKRFGSGPMNCVIKPTASAGTDNVYLCRSQSDVKKYFSKMMGAVNMLGNLNSEVVVQEFLEGKEYVVDSVSRDGKHKVITIWEYDKRSCNDTNFVYFGMRLKSGEGKREQELIAYMKRALTALGIVNGASHGEVMYTPTGPCLVEVGSRPHGGEGSWVPLVNKCLGRNQVQCYVDSVLDEKAFQALPEYPTLEGQYGCEVFLVSRVEGKLKALPRLDEVRKLKSFFQLDMLVKPGEMIKKTIDCITRPGSIRLAHTDPIQIEADFLRIREMEVDNFFVLE